MTGMTARDNQANPAPLVVTRPRALEDLPESLERIGGRKALLVVGPGCASPAERVKNLLGRRCTGSFTDAVAHNPSWEVNLAVASAQEVHADSVIAIGGGSSAGYAKIMALALRLPWIAIPTTLSGAEMTSRYTVTTDKGKEAGNSPWSAARVVLHDPDLFDIVPRDVLASSGMTAVAACLEVLARQIEPARMTAEKGLRILWETLPRLLDDTSDTDLRVQAIEGASFAGTALEIAGPGPAQLLAEDLGARHRCDHGRLMACLTPMAAQNVELVRELAGDGPVPTLIQDFARDLGLPVELNKVCPLPDTEVASRLSGRADLASHADPTALLRVLAGPAGAR
jgi:maleylacetate reductase